MGSSALARDWTRAPLHWECGVSATEPPGSPRCEKLCIFCALLHLTTKTQFYWWRNWGTKELGNLPTVTHSVNGPAWQLCASCTLRSVSRKLWEGPPPILPSQPHWPGVLGLYLYCVAEDSAVYRACRRHDFTSEFPTCRCLEVSGRGGEASDDLFPSHQPSEEVEVCSLCLDLQQGHGI